VTDTALLDARIDHLALEQLEQTVDRFPEVDGWPGLLGDQPPPERPAEPAYLLPFEFDPQPMTPSIDEFARVTMNGDMPAIVHLRMQKLYQENIGALLYRESQRLAREHSCPVITAVLLLWKEADGPAMTGHYAIPSAGVFRYELTRLWEKDVDEMFGSPATLAFTPLAKFAPERLPEVLRRMEEGIEARAGDEEWKDRLWFLAYSGMGVRYPAEQVDRWLAHKLDFIHRTNGCRRALSDGYYAGYSQGQEEGKLHGALTWIEKVGGRRLGAPSAEVSASLKAIRNLDRLEQVAARVLKGASWTEVLPPAEC
jgi:hypothetical protein